MFLILVQRTEEVNRSGNGLDISFQMWYTARCRPERSEYYEAISITRWGYWTLARRILNDYLTTRDFLNQIESRVGVASTIHRNSPESINLHAAQSLFIVLKKKAPDSNKSEA